MEMKRHLFLEGNRLLGSLLYYEDAQGRPCLKLSIEHKIAGDLWVEERKTGKTRGFLPTQSDGMSADVSYRFADNLVEVKTQIPGERPRPVMTEVPTPPQNYLFMIRLRDWGHRRAECDADSLMLATSWPCKEVVIFASLPQARREGPYPQDGDMEVRVALLLSISRSRRLRQNLDLGSVKTRKTTKNIPLLSKPLITGN